MIRTKQFTIAAVLQCLLGLVDLIGALPILAAGREGLAPPPGLEGGPPFWAGVLFLIFSVMSLFGAYGLWLNQKWGKVLTLITRVIMGLFGLGDVLNALSISNIAIAASFMTYVVASILVIVLVLSRAPKVATA